MAIWDSISGALFGRKPTTFDPYEQDRQTRMNALQGAMGEYDKMMSTPGGAIPQAYRDQMLGEVEQDVRNQNPGAGQSGFVNDRVSRAKNDARVKLLNTELGQLNKQRDYMQSLVTMNQPKQQLPGETGMVQKAGSDLAGQAVRGLGDVILGRKDDDYDEMLKRYFGTGANAQQGTDNTGGWGVGR
jgi:hypothetical protein